MIKNPDKTSLIKQITFVFRQYWKQITVFILMVLILSLFFPRGKTLLYSYQLNDIAQEEVVAPFNFPILKLEDQLQNDLNEAIKSEPYLFTRSQDVVDNQIKLVNDYFQLIKDLQIANNQLRESRNDLYRKRFSDQYNSARVTMQSDSTALSILNQQVSDNFSFATDNEKWNMIFESDPEDPNNINLESFKNDIIQIARNRWAEGIFDISISEIISEQVAVRTTGEDAAQLTLPTSYNDIQDSWSKARIDVTKRFPEIIDLR